MTHLSTHKTNSCMWLGRENVLVYYANGIMLNIQVQHTIKNDENYGCLELDDITDSALNVCVLFVGQQRKSKKVKFQRHVKDNTDLSY